MRLVTPGDQENGEGNDEQRDDLHDRREYRVD
jgi:hypothetical protein